MWGRKLRSQDLISRIWESILNSLGTYETIGEGISDQFWIPHQRGAYRVNFTHMWDHTLKPFLQTHSTPI